MTDTTLTYTTVTIEPLGSLESLKQVVRSCGLPVDDIGDFSGAQFFGISEGDALIAVVGLELHGNCGLLRSLAVLPNYRNAGLGDTLVNHIESVAKQCGVEQLYLLTTSAEDYFLRLGYVRLNREGAPQAIQATSQFAGLCPASSALLMKQLIT